MARIIKPGQKGKSPIPKEDQEILSYAERETDERLQCLANRENAALIAFIAPYVGVKVSPNRVARATINLPDEFGMEHVVKKLTESNVTKAYFLINSPGGGLDSAYKIARAMRVCIPDITTFVPHIAASGGTLLALTGNQIVMGPMSHITPLDVQIYSSGAYHSAATFMRFYNRAVGWFETTTPDDAPYPSKALTDKLDPLLMEEWDGAMMTTAEYVAEILDLSGYEQAVEIAARLVYSYSSHSYVINEEKAKALGLNVRNAMEYGTIWQDMRYWLGKYVMEQGATHHIRYTLPSPNSNDVVANTDAGETATPPRKGAKNDGK